MRRIFTRGNCLALSSGLARKDDVLKTILPSPLGPLTARAENDALSGLWFAGQKHFPQDAGQWTFTPEHPVFVALQDWLRDYFDGKFREVSFPLRLHGTVFQESVWAMLREIPVGHTVTYGELATRLSGPKRSPATLARAVGAAVGRNPISILVPCHRVLGTKGALTGYAGGLDRKRALLHLEAPVALKNLSVHRTTRSKHPKVRVGIARTHSHLKPLRNPFPLR